MIHQKIKKFMLPEHGLRSKIIIPVFSKITYFRLKHIFDPRGPPTVTAGSYHYFRACCLYVRPRFSESRKKQSSNEKNNRYWRESESGQVDHLMVQVSCSSSYFLF